MKEDLHTHTIFSDGRDTPEEMVKAAIKKGIQRYGISDHSYTSFDKECCMAYEAYDEYKDLIKHLKSEYRNDIELLCGIEYDYYSDQIPIGFDYVIGSVHYLKLEDEYLSIDLDRDTFARIAREYFDNDLYSLCEAYYETLGNIADRCHIDIIGHFDLISKFNEGNIFFDENDERYVNAWKKAMSKILKDVKCFEINYGAFNKGLRSVPYLNKDMQRFLIDNGGRIIRSSDSHDIDNIGRFTE